jgi:hypothetical protein
MLVASAASESAVRNVMLLARVMTAIVAGNPRLPSTHPMRRYITTPRTVSTLGVKTPLKVPNW